VHPITVVSKYPLREVIQNPEAEGRIAKWALELMGQNISYAPRCAKSQALTDFVAEWTEIQTPPAPVEHETWIMYVDGSVMKEGAGVGLVGDSPRGPLKQAGESPLKTHNEPKPNAPRLSMQGMAHATVAPTAHKGGPLKDSLEQAPPRSRAHAVLGRVPPRSRECAYLEQAPPRSRVRSALERAPPRSRALRTRAPAPVRGHLMP
jgi:hypothetical protein